MTTTSFRVSPVTRYNLTCKTQGFGYDRVGHLGEFPSAEAAAKVGRALMRTTPDSCLSSIDGLLEFNPDPEADQYIVVSQSLEADAKVLYAYSKTEAEALKNKCQAEHGVDFRVFVRAHSL